MKNKLTYYKDLYEHAKEAHAPAVERMERNMRQYLGSDEIDGSTERALTVRNITYEIIESIVSADVPEPKADPECFSDRRDRCARSIERLCTAVKNKLPFESMNDTDERYTYVFGGSVWYVEWDDEIHRSDEIGGVRVHSVSPLDFIPQPGIYEIADMEYCFIRSTTTKGALMRKYSLTEEQLSGCENEYTCGESDDGELVSVIIAFYKDDCGEVGRLIFSGDVLISDTPSYYKRKMRICKSCAKPEGACECVDSVFKTLDLSVDMVSGDRVGHGAAGGITAIPYYKPHGFPIVIRRNSSDGEGLFGTSDCERIRYEQQAINKIESRILQKLIRAGVTPVMPEDATVSLSNSIFGQVIRMRPGESLENYGKIDTTPDISQDILEADRLYDHAKRVIGISDALQGLDSAKVESGYARELKILQSGNRLESKRRLKYLAYSEIYRLIFEHFLAFADEPRSLSYRDGLGRIHVSAFDRYDFIEWDEVFGFYYGDGYLFSADVSRESDYQREALWEQNLENLRTGALGDPASPVTLHRYWQCQERGGYPYARENVEFFKSIIESEENARAVTVERD